MNSAILALIGLILGSLIFAVGFLTYDILVGVGMLLVAASVIYPFLAPAKG